MSSSNTIPHPTTTNTDNNKHHERQRLGALWGVFITGFLSLGVVRVLEGYTTSPVVETGPAYGEAQGLSLAGAGFLFRLGGACCLQAEFIY